MGKKIEIGIALAGVVISLAAWLFPISSLYTSSSNVVGEPFYKVFFPSPTLLVSGTGARVKILKGSDDSGFSGGEVSKTGAESTVYIRYGQKINLELTGTGAEVLVQSGLMQYIKINNTATGGTIHEL